MDSIWLEPVSLFSFEDNKVRGEAETNKSEKVCWNTFYSECMLCCVHVAPLPWDRQCIFFPLLWSRNTVGHKTTVLPWTRNLKNLFLWGFVGEHSPLAGTSISLLLLLVSIWQFQQGVYFVAPMVCVWESPLTELFWPTKLYFTKALSFLFSNVKLCNHLLCQYLPNAGIKLL